MIYLQFKDKFIDIFKTWQPKIENKSDNSIKVLYTDKRREFILAKFKEFCEKTGITIKYTASYIYKENGIIKRELKTIVTIKKALLINNALLLEFWVKVIYITNYLHNCLPIKSRRGELILKEC